MQKKLRDSKEGESRGVRQKRKTDFEREKDSMCHCCLTDVGAHVQGVKEVPQLTAGKETGTLVPQLKETELSQQPERVWKQTFP